MTSDAELSEAHHVLDHPEDRLAGGLALRVQGLAVLGGQTMMQPLHRIGRLLQYRLRCKAIQQPWMMRRALHGDQWRDPHRLARAHVVFAEIAGVGQQVLRRARAMGNTVDTVPIFAVTGGRTVPVQVTWVGTDSAVMQLATVEMRAAVSPDGALLGLAIPTQNAHVIRLDGAHPLVIRKIDYGAPPGAPYTAEDVTVHTPAGLALTGALTLPTARSGTVPAAVTITGPGAADRDVRIPSVRGFRLDCPSARRRDPSQ